MHQAYSLMLPPFAPDAAVSKSSISLSEIQSSIDSLRDISITGLDGFANAPARLQGVAQQRIEPRRVDAVSPLSFGMSELNGSLVLHRSISSNIFKLPIPAQNHTGFGLLAQEAFQERADLKELHYEIFPIDSSIPSTDGLFSILTSASMMPSSLKGEPSPNWVGTEWGNIRIDCTTNPASGGNPEGILGTNAKINPGWFSNVNWSDDDGDGWQTQAKLAVADPSTTYTPDKDDTTITNGDPDLRKFKVYVSANTNTGGHDWSFRLTFGSNVAVYEENTKAGVVPNHKTFSTGELTTEDAFTKSKTLWLEGKTASAAFADVHLQVEYVGGDIPMLGTYDLVHVTVFGVTQLGFYSGQQNTDNTKKYTDFTDFGLAPYSGPSNWDHADANHKSTKGMYNQMEDQGTVFPSVASCPNPYPVSFNMHRVRNGVMWVKNNNGAWEEFRITNPLNGLPQLNRQWVNDDFANGADKVLVPTSLNHIYFIDSPGTPNHIIPPAPSYYQHHLNFLNCATVLIYGSYRQCSDFLRWKSQLVTKPNAAGTAMIRDTTKPQTLEDGWFTLPANPV